jgi:hypothetical protein
VVMQSKPLVTAMGIALHTSVLNRTFHVTRYLALNGWMDGWMDGWKFWWMGGFWMSG